MTYISTTITNLTAGHDYGFIFHSDNTWSSGKLKLYVDVDIGEIHMAQHNHAWTIQGDTINRELVFVFTAENPSHQITIESEPYGEDSCLAASEFKICDYTLRFSSDIGI